MSIPGSINPLFLGAAGQATGGGEYQIERSVRFNAPDSAYLSRTPSAGNRTTWTWAGWVKRSDVTSSDRQALFSAYGAGNDTDYFIFGLGGSTDSGKLFWTQWTVEATSTAVFRDPSAWYHIVANYNGSNLTFYVNNAQVLQSAKTGNLAINGAFAHSIGRNSDGTKYFNGYLADIHFIDGQALDPSSFGEFDTNGVWQPIDASGLTYGTNGFHLPFSDNSTAAALGTDTSGNGHTWTVNNIAVGGAQPVTVTLTSTSGNDSQENIDKLFDGNTSNPMVLVGNTGTTSTCTFTPYLAVTSGRLYTTGGSASSKTIVTDVGNISVSSTGWTSLGSATKIYSFSAVMQPGDGYWGVSAIESNSSILTSPGSVTVTAGNDSLVDSPTNVTQTDTGVGGEVVGNYATFNPLDNGGLTLSNGNLDITEGLSASMNCKSTIGIISGKYYWELTNNSLDYYSQSGTNTNSRAGISTKESSITSVLGSLSTQYVYEYAGVTGSGTTGKIINNNIESTFGLVIQKGDVLNFACDFDSGKIWYGKNGTFFNSGNPATGANASQTFTPGGNTWLPTVVQRGTGGTNATLNFGARPFAYTAPSGFKALCTTNLPEPTIADGSTVMDVVTWSGDNASPRAISGLNLSPDFVWIKSRSDAAGHALFDAVRGTGNVLRSMDTSAEVANPAFGYVSGFNSDGFALTAGTYPGYESGDTNMTGRTYVAWTWDAGGEPTTDNVAGAGNVPTAGSAKINGANMTTALAGSIPATRLSANASAGFSVVTYTGNATGGATVGHGLGVAPAMFIVKSRSLSESWPVYHASLGATKLLRLEGTGAEETISTAWNNTAPTSTVFSLGSPSGFTNSSGATYVAYCFAPVAGYSSFGSYVGNGSSDGVFVYTGFRSRWILIKVSAGDTGNWWMYDSARSSYNLADLGLYANSSIAEFTSNGLDMLSNGFKIRTANGNTNGSGYTFVWAAFAENPFQYARAR
jgi:hypothetical protein